MSFVSAGEAADADGRRIRALDGLRGVAIVLVAMFHAYARWPLAMPWTQPLKDFAPFKYGYLGVELFFLISGFVILMTLESCASFGDFLKRRWLRLFPAMLAASVLVFATASLLPERPLGAPQARDLAPGLLFFDPSLMNRLLPLRFAALEGSFWSLFVEVQFYFVFGALYFVARRRALSTLIGLFAFGYAYRIAATAHPELANPVAVLLFQATSAQYLGWFALGALAFRYHQTNERIYLYYSLALFCPVIAASVDPDQGIFTACVVLYALFVAALRAPVIGAILASRPFVFLGFVSYPFYLIHENALVALTVKVKSAFPAMPALLAPVPAVALLLALAWLIARYAEPAIRRALKTRLRFLAPAAAPA